ncbi:MAG: bifunctional folylpolyglutamate synthase/dihydrofolate synthase [Nitrospiria bacterium]
MAYIETLDYLYQLRRHGIRLGLKRMETLLALVQHPERQFRSVHIGGTNGKGSTAAMVASALIQGGYRVGLYTSPHLIDFSERITVSGTPISSEEIVRTTELLREKVESEAPHLSGKITFFEFTTALAFLFFAEQKVDLAVVEVGMGGRFDATNVLTPLATGITHIDMDHERYLGSTILDIAAEKAGIIKRKIPVVTSASQLEVLSLLEETARFKHAPLIRLGHEITVAPESSEETIGLNGGPRFLYRGGKERAVECGLLGRYQIDNAAVALGLLEVLHRNGLSLSEEDLLEGIRRVSWDGRLEVFRKRPLILLDGAHNPSGAKMLGRFLTEVDPIQRGKHWMLIGIMSDKNATEVMSPLVGWADEVVLTRPEIERAADPHKLAVSLQRASEMGAHNEGLVSRTIHEKISDAVAYINALIQPQDTLVITGSLYTVGEAKALLKGTTPSMIRG